MNDIAVRSRSFRAHLYALSTAIVTAATLSAQSPSKLPAETLLDRDVLTALDEELSGVAAKDHVGRLAQMHRVPASPGFHEAIEYVMGRARAIGLADVHVETFPGDGVTYFGTLHGNRGWSVQSGTLDEVQPHHRRIISADDVRLAVADNSESADVTVDLVDVGAGTARTDYAGKDVRGKLVLCDALPSACHRQAVEEMGAAGLISYNSNQVSGWWRDDQDLIRWGHLDAKGHKNTFAIMISLREARDLQQRLARGERITLHAVVRAKNDDALPYETLIATIPGSNPAAGDIVFSCHLDHEKPGANDNASGCASNLEIARTLKTLIDTKRIPPPIRTIRFIWPSEMTGTIAYLMKYPDMAARMRAVVHLDMVGGDPFITKSILHVTRSPWSIPSVTDDVEEVFGRYVIDGAFRAAGYGDRTHAVQALGGSKDAFWADITPWESGSDNWIYQEGGFAIPTIYLRDHPDVYIHTTRDVVDNIEPTKIKRSAFIAAASGYYLATMPDRGATLLRLSFASAHERMAEDARRAIAMSASAQPAESGIIVREGLQREQRRLQSITRLLDIDSIRRVTADELKRLSDGLAETAAQTQAILPPLPSRTGYDVRVPVRNPAVKGPLEPAGDWLRDKAGPSAASIAIMQLPNSADVTYEIANFVNGERSVGAIRDAVSAEFGPVDQKVVAEYIDLLAKAGAVSYRP